MTNIRKLIGIAVLLAAKKEDNRKRAEQERQRDEESLRRELILRQEHVTERRSKALDKILEELAALDRLRRLVAGLEGEAMTADNGHRVAEFLALAQGRLALRETALSAEGLEQRFEKQKLFGDDDDHGFRPPYGYY